MIPHDHILLNSLYMNMMMKDFQDLGAMISPMIGKVEQDFMTLVG